MKSESNEQWKSGGDCTKCRRRKYCKKTCAANRKFDRRIISAIVRKRTGIDAMESVLRNVGK